MELAQAITSPTLSVEVNRKGFDVVVGGLVVGGVDVEEGVVTEVGGVTEVGSVTEVEVGIEEELVTEDIEVGILVTANVTHGTVCGGSVQGTVVDVAVIEQPTVMNELTGEQLMVEELVTHSSQKSVTVLVAHTEPVVVAALVVPEMSQPKIVPHVEGPICVAVVRVPETPNDVVAPHRDAVSVSQPSSGSSGNSGGPPPGGTVI